jgi:arsenite methyltransferase
MSNVDKTHELVKQAYGQVAETRQSCCGTPALGAASCCCGPQGGADVAVPEADLGLSCGDPLGFAEVRPGDTVLDLGSGAGRDAFTAARLAGPFGQVIGVDMTPQMLALARRNAQLFACRAGFAPVEFREGYIEALPLKDASVDLVISNCVINLSPDKPQVFREACRALRPGGRLVVSDIVLERELPEAVRRDATLYSACLSGALLRADYLGAIQAAGFTQVEVLSDRLYYASNVNGDPLTTEYGSALEGAASAITVRAVKPA